MKTYDVIVAGVGTAGSATCLELAQRGRTVLGLDAFSPPHRHGSHHGRSRSIRRVYLEGTSYVPMALAAWDSWRKLERDWGEELLRETGNLTLAPRDGKALTGFFRSAERCDIPHEALSAAEVRRRWPALQPPDHFRAGLEKEAGILRPERCIKMLLQAAAAAGAELRFDEPVVAWSNEGEAVRVTTARNTYECDRLVVTAGARTPKLLGDMHPKLRPKRVVVHWVAPPPGETFRFGKIPVNFWQMEDGLEWYALPVVDPQGRVKVAAHNRLEDCDPDAMERNATEREREEARRLLATAIPALAAREMTSETCLYAMTPDKEFVMGAVPNVPNVILGAFAGHGFKFAPALGEVLADMAVGQTPRFDVGMFAPERFL